MKNQDVQDPEKIKTMLKHGEYVIKELEALYMLRKYRTLKRRYYNEPIPMEIKTEVESKNQQILPNSLIYRDLLANNTSTNQ